MIWKPDTDRDAEKPELCDLAPSTTVLVLRNRGKAGKISWSEPGLSKHNRPLEEGGPDEDQPA